MQLLIDTKKGTGRAVSDTTAATKCRLSVPGCVKGARDSNQDGISAGVTARARRCIWELTHQTGIHRLDTMDDDLELLGSGADPIAEQFET